MIGKIKEALVQVQDVMSKGVECCTPETSLRYVARMMADRNVGAIPVVETTDSMKPIGIVTDRDIVVRVFAQGRDPNSLRAADCMSANLLVVRCDEDVRECVQQMEQRQVRRVPIVDLQGRLCGILSQADIAMGLPEDMTGQLVRDISETPMMRRRAHN